MTASKKLQPTVFLESSEDFRQAKDANDLWQRLNRQLSSFGISGILYGTQAIVQRSTKPSIFFDSLPTGYLTTKESENLLLSDEFIQAGLTESAPFLWDDSSIIASRLVDLSPDAKRSLEIDWSFAVTTGVTIPMQFAGGLGTAAMGCHAAGMSWAEFRGVWDEYGNTITGISNAFDAVLRQDHRDAILPLNAEERECLLWLSAGLKQKQIADRLLLTDKQVEKRLTTARSKLRATSTIQAMVIALTFGLIDP